MKKIMLAVMLTVGIATFASAQDTTKLKKTPEERAAQMTKLMEKKLNLTADQAKQINSILVERATAMSEPKIKGIKGGRVAKMQAASEADTKINAVLTPAQQKQYAEMEQKTKEKMLQRKKAKFGDATTPVTPPAP